MPVRAEKEELSDEMIQSLFEEIELNEALDPIIIPPIYKQNNHHSIYKTPIIQSTTKKGSRWARTIIGKSYYEAMYELSSRIQKIPKFLLQCLIRSGSTLAKRSLNTQYMVIKGIITSRKRRIKKITYHAKTKNGRRFRDYIDFKIYFQRKTIKDFYKDMIMGKGSSSFARMLREKFQTQDEDLETIRSLSWLLTSNGRKQQKELFKRRVLHQYFDLKNSGVRVPLKILNEKQAEEEARDFMVKWAHLFDDKPDINKNFEARKAMFLERTKTA